MHAADGMNEARGSACQWGKIGRAGRNWVLGAGLLAFHVGLYLLMAVALVLLNLYRSPGHLWVQGVLLPWGIVVVVHAVLVGVAVTLANADRLVAPGEDTAPVGSGARGVPRLDPRPSGRFSVRPVTTAIDEGSPWQRASRFVRDRVILPTAEKATSTTTTMRARLADRRADVPGTDGAGPAAGWPTQPHTPRTTLDRTRAVLATGATQTGEVAGRALVSTRRAIARAQTRLSSGGRNGEGKGDAARGPDQHGAAPPPGPASGWPTPRSQRSPVAPQRDTSARPNSWGAAVPPANAHRDAANQPAAGSPASANPMSSTTAGAPRPTSETESAWMEAAAAAWLARQQPAGNDDAAAPRPDAPPPSRS